MVVRTACSALLTALLLTACGGGHHAAPTTAPAVATPTPDVGIERLTNAVPAAGALPPRLLVEGNVLATGDLTVVNALSGPTAQLYALVPAGAVLHPHPSGEISCEIDIAPGDGTAATQRVQAAAFANLQACQGQLGCGQLVIGSIAGESRAVAQANEEKLAEYQACLQRITSAFHGPPVDGRFLLQPSPAATSAGLPVAVIIYPSADAFTTSAREVGASGAFRAASILGRFEASALPGCALQFYPATASVLAWCGGHDPEHDTTVGGVANQLSSVVEP